MCDIACGVVGSKLSDRGDIRQEGRGKTGATDVLRAAGRKAAVLVVTLDAGKGVLAVVLARLIVGDNYLAAQVAAALAAMAGHIWPVFLKFRGGRGVATFFGGLAVLSPVAAMFGGVVLIGTMGLTRFASVGSMAGAIRTGAVLVPLSLLTGSPWSCLVYA